MPIMKRIIYVVFSLQNASEGLEGAWSWGAQDGLLEQLNRPHGVAAMSAGGVWVADSANNRLCLLH